MTEIKKMTTKWPRKWLFSISSRTWSVHLRDISRVGIIWHGHKRIERQRKTRGKVDHEPEKKWDAEHMVREFEFLAPSLRFSSSEEIEFFHSLPASERVEWPSQLVGWANTSETAIRPVFRVCTIKKWDEKLSHINPNELLFIDVE